MSKKKINIRPKLELKNVEQKIDNWIAESTEPKENPKISTNSIKEKITEKDSKLTIMIPDYIHRRIKKHCVIHGVTMKEKLIEIFEREFPET